MKIHLYNKDGTKYTAEVPATEEIVYTFTDSYRYYRRGSARSSVTFYETNALHVTNAVIENL